ncbi:class I SAM-dependent methyltransferase [Couchioplanes caeruleus]|uniref:class I SAM-dependent methyltransferase n=1 Tax=Couchioplanes caeruleus TaxID=56438 RepID=UPI0020BE765E|nr:class I SAM-dependent methyltransferase [Couchioplanes caeruleus]UQU62091.1 class I SAM-dependent methyltransferase [Couchioplanes caeruleus]
MTTDFDDATRGRMAAIEANWDERTPIHLASRFYDVAGRDPEDWFAAYEWADLGDLSGKDVLHLQCHLGTETVAFARRGARTVTGLDLSGAAVEAARRIAADAGAAIEYVQGNVYDAAALLGGRRFDVVYTGKGALCYLPDLQRWAAVVAGLLRPGGVAYVAEFHPVLRSLGLVDPEPDNALTLRHDMLGGRGAAELDATYTYTDGPALTSATTSYEWEHGLGEVVTALSRAGLAVRSLTESDELPWPRWPHMERTARGWWRLPGTAPKVPLFYALLAEASSTDPGGRSVTA